MLEISASLRRVSRSMRSTSCLRTKEAVIYAGSKPYRGSLEVKWRTSGLMVVSTLDLEAYLYGVVPKEAPSQWEMAALRAQAIVARTYALV